MVAALETATDQRPQVAGKPQPPLLLDALARGDFERPLVIGDRLDTDIAGANAAGLPSMLVLTGVSSVADMVYADAAERPNYLAADLRSLNADSEYAADRAAPGVARRGRPAGRHRDSTGHDAEDPLASCAPSRARSGVRASTGVAFAVLGGDHTAHEALERWSLAGPSDQLA